MLRLFDRPQNYNPNGGPQKPPAGWAGGVGMRGLKVALFPFKAGVGLVGYGFWLVKLGEVNIGHQLCFYVVDRFLECLDKLGKILLVEKHFLFLEAKTVALWLAAAFGQNQVIVIGTGSFHVEKVSSFPRPHPF